LASSLTCIAASAGTFDDAGNFAFDPRATVANTRSRRARMFVRRNRVVDEIARWARSHRNYGVTRRRTLDDPPLDPDFQH